MLVDLERILDLGGEGKRGHGCNRQDAAGEQYPMPRLHLLGRKSLS